LRLPWPLPWLMGERAVCARDKSKNTQSTADARLTDMDSKSARQLEQRADELDGVMGLAVKDLTTGESFAVNAAMVFPQASSIKITVLMELLRQAQAGKLKLDDRVAIKQVHMVGGSGVLQFFGDASSAISLRDLAVLMIVLSDNTATNILIDQVGQCKRYARAPRTRADPLAAPDDRHRSAARWPGKSLHAAGDDHAAGAAPRGQSAGCVAHRCPAGDPQVPEGECVAAAQRPARRNCPGQ